LASKSFDVRVLKRYLNPQASDDLNRFLEKLPQHAGNTVLIAAGIAWGAAAALGLFAMMQTKQLTELRGELQASEALKPVVPVVKMAPASPAEIKEFIENIKNIYTNMNINGNANTVTIQSKDTGQFNQFREAIGHVVNGGNGWKIRIESFCVGRECAQNTLNAVLKVEKLQINKPTSEAK
jgi:hypothetical protein